MRGQASVRRTSLSPSKGRTKWLTSNSMYSSSVVARVATSRRSVPHSSVSRPPVQNQTLRRPQGEPRLGGTCLNVGCVPSKALLHTSHLFEESQHAFAAQGIKVKGEVSIDVPTMIDRKSKVVDQLTSGVKFLFKKNKVTFLPGHGSFVGKSDGGWQVKVGDETVEAKQVIVATGSSARHLAGVPVDNTLVCDNIGALDLDAVPKRLGLIGSGVIGLEMGSVWRRLGAEVTILEAMDSFLGAADQDVAKEAQKVFAKQGMDVKLGVKVGKVTPAKNKKSVTVEYENKDGATRRSSTSSSSRSGGSPTRQVSMPRPWVSRSTSGVSWWLMITARPISTAYGRSVMWCVARCSRTRRWKRASWLPRSWPARQVTATSTPCPG